MRDFVGLGGAGGLSLHLGLTRLWARPYWVVRAEGSEWEWAAGWGGCGRRALGVRGRGCPCFGPI